MRRRWGSRAQGGRLEVEDLGKLFLPFRGKVVADEDEGQVQVGEEALFYDIRVLLVQKH